MPVSRPLSAAFATLALACSLASLPAQQPAQAKLDSTYAHLPLSFEPNRGQTAEQVQFLARTPQASVFLSGPDAVFQTSSFRQDAHGKPQLAGSSAVRMHLAGAASSPAASPEQPLPGKVNYLRGKDRAQWQQDLPTFGGVRLAAVYPGVDLRYHGHAGQLEYDFLIAPQADPSAIRLQFQGASAHVEANGDLLLPVAHGEKLRFDKPVAFQIVDGRRVPVQAAFTLAANHDITFTLGAYDHTRELVIDPTLVYLGTLASGIAQTNVSQITVDSAGALYLIGTTNETQFPTTPGAYQTVCGPANATAVANNVTYCNGTNNTAAFITKLSPDGTQLVYSTFLSGHGGLETGTSIAVDSAGIAYLLGETASNDFPITADAFQKLCGPGQPPGFEPAPVVPTSQCVNFHNGGGTEYTINGPEAYFAKLNAAGSSLLYASYLGGTLPVYPYATALDATGNWYLYVQTSLRPAGDLYGSGGGNVQYPGLTSSGYQTVAAPGTYVDNGAALSKFSNDGRTLLYGTYFGDNAKNIGIQPQSMAVGSNGIAFIGGYSIAVNLPTTAGVIKQSCSAANSDGTCQSTDGFVAAIDTTKSGASSLAWSTRLAGSGTRINNTPNNQVIGLTVDSGNDVFATGYTFDHTFPVGSSGYQPTCPNYDPTDTLDRCDSAYVVKINPTGTAILNGTYLNDPRVRSPESAGYNVRLDSKGQVYLYGRSNDGAGNFPTVNPLQSYQGGDQLFIATFSSDLSTLFFSTRFGNPALTGHSVSAAGGMVLDASDSIYFAGTTTETTFAGTAGTYNTAATTGQGNHPFFAKLSKLLAASATTLILPSGTTGVGKPLTLAAKVAGVSQTTPIPTGTVTFTYTNTATPTVAGSATLDATGTAILNTTAPTGGATYTVTATYAGDTNYGVSTSAPGSLAVVYAATPSITLTIPNPIPKVGTAVAFNVTVAMPAGSSVVPTGTVAFKDDATTLATVPLTGGAASYSTSTLAAGTHPITATYSGDATYSGAVTPAQIVTVSTYTPNLAFSATPASVQTGGSVTFSATFTSVTGGPAVTGTVKFLSDGVALTTATLANGIATYSTTALAAGTHTLTAVYSGDANYGTLTSTPVTVTITRPTAAISLTSNLSVAPANLSVTLYISVTTAAGTGTPTGSVNLFDGANNLANVVLVNGTANYFGTFPVGTNNITAVYNGDTSFASVTSAPLAITVYALSTTTTTLSASAANYVQGAPVLLTATIAAPGNTNGKMPTGNVTFYEGGMALGVESVSGTTATDSVVLAPGTHKITAVYGGDLYFYSSVTTSALTVTVMKEDVTVIATPSPLVVQAGHSATQSLLITPNNGFTGTITLACGTLPQYVSCSFNPLVVTFGPNSIGQSSTLTVYTDAAHSASLHAPTSFFKRNGLSLAMLFWLPGSALTLLGLRRKSTLNRRFKSLLTLGLLITALGSTCALSGCGGGNNFVTAQPGSYSFPVTITASDGTTQILTTNITIH